MEKEYIRELDRTFLLLAKDQIDEDEYILQMVLRGRLPGVLPLSIAMKDGTKSLRADVTACTSIVSRYKNVDLTGRDLRRILFAIRDTALKMPKLLMSVRDLYLNPEFIFLGPGGDQILMCYIPHISESEPDSVRSLSEFILKRIDHSDQTAADLAYEFFDQVSSDSYVLSDVLQKLTRDSAPLRADKGGNSQASDSSKALSYQQDDAFDEFPLGSVRNHMSPSKGRTPSGQSSGSRVSAGRSSDRKAVSGRSSAGKSSVGHASSGHSSSGRSSSGRSSSGRSSSGRSSSGHRKNSSVRHSKHKTRHSSSRRSRRRKSKTLYRLLIPVTVIIAAACAAVIVFQMDLTQICGMGFLCAALIWMIRNSLEKRANEHRNVWFDEDENVESDDQFYQSLRRELYAEDMEADQRNFSDSFKAPETDRRNSFASFENPEERTRMLRRTRTNPVLLSLQKDSCPDIDLDQDHLILGKSRSQADIILSDSTVSRKHARIERRTDGYYVTDLFSTNGTFLDGHRLESGHAVLLNDGAQLTIASLHFQISIPNEESLAERPAV